MQLEKISFLGLRIALGFIFLWAFLDKLLGLGFSTLPERAWINGGSPTSGFLLNATKGPFAEVFQAMAGVAAVDWLFMLGLLFVGVTLLTKRFVVFGALAGIAMLSLMYLAALWPSTNPVLDQHVVYILVLLAFIARERRK